MTAKRRTNAELSAEFSRGRQEAERMLRLPASASDNIDTDATTNSGGGEK